MAIVTISISCTVSDRLIEILVKNRHFEPTYLHLSPTLGLTSLEFCRDLWHQKIRVPWLSYGIAAWRYPRFKHRLVTNRQADGQMDRHTMAHLSVFILRYINSFIIIIIIIIININTRTTLA